MPLSRLNIFANYQKLEDNVTHGFLSLLNCLSSETSAQIVNALSPDIKLGNKLSYELQSPSPLMRNTLSKCSMGILLGISAWDEKIVENKSEKIDSRADGWVSDGKTAIMIESKVVGRFSGHQLERHRSQLVNLLGNEVKIQVFTTTWQKIDNQLKHFLIDSLVSGSESKLISEFRSYLQMEGLTLEFEPLFNAVKYDTTEQWISDQPKTCLRETKARLLNKLETTSLQLRTEQVNEHKYKALWLRLFNFEHGSADWRSSVYLNPDEIAVDILAFKPGRKLPDVLRLIEAIRSSVEKTAGFETQRVWIYASNYGKRRNVQSGRNYDYNVLNFNLARGSTRLKNRDSLRELLSLLDVKQIGIKYAISNPGATSKTYWSTTSSHPDNVNHADAFILKHPDLVIDQLSWFLKTAMESFRLTTSSEIKDLT